MSWEFLTSQEALKGRFKRRQRAGDLVIGLSAQPLWRPRQEDCKFKVHQGDLVKGSLGMWLGWFNAGLVCMEPRVSTLTPHKSGLMAHTSNPSTLEMEAGG